MAIDQRPVLLDTTGSAANVTPLLVATSNVRKLFPNYAKDVDGELWGIIRVPQNYASGGKIILRITTPATGGGTIGVGRFTVSTLVKGSTEVLDAALTAETAQDITLSNTGYSMVDATFTLTTTPVAGKDMIVKIQHNGTHANDTCTNDIILVNAVLEYTVG